MLEAAIENYGFGYELAVAVERTDDIPAEQSAPITLTDANGNAIKSLPTTFMLCIAPGSGQTSGVVPLPAGGFDPTQV